MNSAYSHYGPASLLVLYHYFIIPYANNKKPSFLIFITKMQNLLERVVLSILESQQACLKCLPFEIGRVLPCCCKLYNRNWK